jgi:hypothetical protein
VVGRNTARMGFFPFIMMKVLESAFF